MHRFAVSLRHTAKAKKHLANGTRQKRTRQSCLCRVFFCLRRVPWAHGKPMNSGSEMNKASMHMAVLSLLLFHAKQPTILFNSRFLRSMLDPSNYHS